MRNLLAVFVIALFGFGCVNAELVKSYDGFLSTAGKEYVDYVNGDPEFSDLQKRVRVNNYKAARELVDSLK